MHEASLMASLMRQIESVASAEEATHVVSVRVWLGALSHMSEQHFAEHFSLASAGTIVEGARLGITLSTDLRHADAELIRLESVEVEN
jgi:hydrogenase nickel incorporation protein HypA/HybF